MQYCEAINNQGDNCYINPAHRPARLPTSAQQSFYRRYARGKGWNRAALLRVLPTGSARAGMPSSWLPLLLLGSALSACSGGALLAGVAAQSSRPRRRAWVGIDAHAHAQQHLAPAREHRARHRLRFPPARSPILYSTPPNIAAAGRER